MWCSVHIQSPTPQKSLHRLPFKNEFLEKKFSLQIFPPKFFRFGDTELNKIREIIKNLEFEDRKIHFKYRYSELMNLNNSLDDLRIAQHYIIL